VSLDTSAASLLISFGDIGPGNKRTDCLLSITLHLEISKGYRKDRISFICKIRYSILLIFSVTVINQHSPKQQCVLITTVYCLPVCSACGSTGLAAHTEHASDPFQILQRTSLFFLICRFQD